MLIKSRTDESQEIEAKKKSTFNWIIYVASAFVRAFMINYEIYYSSSACLLRASSRLILIYIHRKIWAG